MRVKILGTGSYAPPRVITNHDLEKLVDTNDEWITERTGIKQRHAADPGVPTSEIAAIAAKGLRRVGVLGTKYTMKADFLRNPLARDHDISIIAPEEGDARETHRIIYEELARGCFLDSSRETFRGAIARLKERGAEGVILGCTELPLLIAPEDADIPLFDTAQLHAVAAVDMALA